MPDSDQSNEGEAFSADMLLIEELVEELGLDRWPGDSETILEVGDLENTRVLAVRHGLSPSRQRVAESDRQLRSSITRATLAGS